MSEVWLCLLIADMFGVLAGEVAAVLTKSDALRALTVANAPRLPVEAATVMPEIELPPPEWTGALPDAPSWADPR
ncbi:hypothetical protein PAGU2595_002000 [Lysobacter xanthus]